MDALSSGCTVKMGEGQNPLEAMADSTFSASDVLSDLPNDLLGEPPSAVFGDPLSNISKQESTSNPAKQSSKLPSDVPCDIFDPLHGTGMEPKDDGKNASLIDIVINPVTSAKDNLPVDDLLSQPEIDIPAKTKTEQPAELRSEERPKDEPLSVASSKPKKDLFEDSPEDLFSELPKTKAKTKPQMDLFGDSSPDLFMDAKAAADTGPGRNAPADLFSEESVATTTSKSAKSNISANSIVTANSKANGVHSDEEEQDIFAEATVELSLDSPHNNRKTLDTTKPSEPASSLSAAAGSSKAQAKTLEELEEEESEDKFELNISITNPEKVGDGMNAYMAYKVSTQTTLPMFRSKTFTVRRRFSDFLGLYEKLSEKHSQNGYIVPPPPEKSLLGMTKVKVGKDDPSSGEFVERRRASLERYLQRVVCHPSLLQDPDVREFLEREELPRAVNTQALSGAGFLKMINKATDAVSKMTIKMNESDVWFEEKLQEVESEDQQLRKLHAVVDSLVSHRKELSVNTAVFAKSVAMLGSSEDNTALSRALSQLAELEDKIEQLHQEQAGNDFFVFTELLADYIRLLGAVRGSFDQRMKSWQRWQDAQTTLQKKREAEAKLLWANKPDKLQQAKDEIAEWEGKVTQYEREFERVSATVRKEVIRFEKEKARDFKKQIIKYLESLLQSQQQLIKYWEAFLPEAKAIA
ncbi:sorting nexin-1a isoform X2 [Denticeps clupeoides]|uniref:sorting nexin-1a isoform X2 n=1 Tax=Denticeps clupeoides TaxID=299321 RepID=UPI0010A37117|nr:sorting nexin-1-like isoform X2 [Denticeps clupeoides]